MKWQKATVLKTEVGTDFYNMYAYNPNIGDFEIKDPECKYNEIFKPFDVILFAKNDATQKIAVKRFKTRGRTSVITNSYMDKAEKSFYIEAYNNKWGRFTMVYPIETSFETLDFAHRTFVYNLIPGDKVLVNGIKAKPGKNAPEYEIVAAVTPWSKSECELPNMNAEEIHDETSRLLCVLEHMAKSKQK